MTGLPVRQPETRGLDRSTLAQIERVLSNAARVTPGIVHLGLGGFHRAHMARFTHDLMMKQCAASCWGIVGVGTRSADAPLIAALTAQDGLYTLVERDAEGETRTIITSIVEALDAGESAAAVLAVVDDSAVRILSLTVTENGYCLDRATKKLDLGHALIRHDLADPVDPRSVIGILVEAYRRRRDLGIPAFTVLTCDNIQHNGEIVRAAVLALAERRDPALAAWIAEHGRFPSTMVDRITPLPELAQIAELERRTGIADRAAVFCETFRQWIIEDDFADGRPDWDAVGAQFVADVSPYEMMKLRLLNCSHLAIASLGDLMGYTTIYDAMNDPLLRRYMQALMERETGPTLLSVPRIDLAQYKTSLVERFANPAIRDTVARVNADAPINLLLDPLRDRLASNQPCPLLALALAAWLRRARSEDERGRATEVDHPMAELLNERAIVGGPDPRSLLGLTGLFGELGTDPRLIEATGVWLASLYATGSRATLAAAATELAF